MRRARVRFVRFGGTVALYAPTSVALLTIGSSRDRKAHEGNQQKPSRLQDN